MRPAARVNAAVAVLDQILEGAPAEKALTNWARRARYAGAKDRRAVRDHVFEALRKRASCARLGGGLTGRGIMMGLLRNQDQPLDDIFCFEPHAPAPLSPQERSFRPGPPDYESAYDWPVWLRDLTEQSLGCNWEEVLLMMRERAPAWIRVNPRLVSNEEVISSLAAEGIDAEADPRLPYAIRVNDRARKLVRSAAYLNGAIEIQDRASQWAVAQLPLKAGMRVLDYCAGGGGKALAIAAQTDTKVFAHDVSAERMKDIAARRDRAGVSVTVVQPGKVPRHVPYDLVLVDAPCSGSGTWRRSPDQKWTLTQGQLDNLISLQAEILAESAPLVATNGILAYATCSVFHTENEAQIDRFLAHNAGWRVSFQGRQTPVDGGDGFGLTILTREFLA